MQKTNKHTQIPLSLAFAILSLCFFVFQKQATLADDTCNSLTDDAKKACEDKVDQAEAYKKIINLKEKQATTIQSQLMLIDKEQARNQADLENTRKNLLTVTEQITDIQRDIKEKEDTLKYQTIVLSGLMQSYYENYQQGLIDIVIANKNFSEIFKNLDYTEQTSLKIKDLNEEIKISRDTLVRDQTELESKKEESEKVKEDLQNKNLNLQSTENKKQTLLTQTQAEKEKYAKLLDDVEQEINDLESSLFSGVDLSDLPPIKKGFFTYPVSPAIISQGYGKTSFSSHYASGKHNGIDFSIKYGNIYAAKGGKVIATGDNGRYAYGKWVAIDHGNGLTTLYGHFSKILVSRGKTVKEAEKIGISGNTGYSTGPHLHFSVFSSKTFDTVESKTVNGLMIPVGASVNPKNYL